MKPTFGGYCVPCGRVAGAHACIIRHTTICTHSHICTFISTKGEDINPWSPFIVLWCSFLCCVDSMKDKTDKTAEVGNLFIKEPQSQLEQNKAAFYLSVRQKTKVFDSCWSDNRKFKGDHGAWWSDCSFKMVYNVCEGINLLNQYWFV